MSLYRSLREVDVTQAQLMRGLAAIRNQSRLFPPRPRIAAHPQGPKQLQGGAENGASFIASADLPSRMGAAWNWNGTHLSGFKLKRNGSRLGCRSSFFLSWAARGLHRTSPHLEAPLIRSQTSQAFESHDAKGTIHLL